MAPEPWVVWLVPPRVLRMASPWSCLPDSLKRFLTPVNDLYLLHHRLEARAKTRATRTPVLWVMCGFVAPTRNRRATQSLAQTCSSELGATSDRFRP